MTRSAIMFANPRAGGARHFLRAVRFLVAAGIEIRSVRFDLTRTLIAAAVEEEALRGLDLVLAFGGDGTVGSVVDAIAGTDAMLGIIAAGTSNNFARSLGVPATVRGSVAVIAGGRERTVGVGEINGHRFAHAAIMGLNVDFARHAERLRSSVGRLSYPVASLLVYRWPRKIAVHIVDGRAEREIETYQLTILNSMSNEPGSSHETDGRHCDLASCSSSDTDSLQAVSVHDLRLRTVLRGLPQIFFERHLGLPGADRFAIREGRITTAEPVPLTLDGEIKTQTPAAIRVIPNGLRVVTP